MKRFSLNLLGILALALCACSRGPTDPQPDQEQKWRVALTTPNHSIPTSYSVFVTPTVGKTLSTCLEGKFSTHPKMAVTQDGMEITLQADTLLVVVKAAGYRTAQAILTRKASEPSHHTIHLQALPEPVVTTDYATAFFGSSGRETLRSMAVANGSGTNKTLTLKFFVDRLDSAPVVYFQNTIKHPLHYNFVRDVLGQPLTRSEFEIQTYQGLNRRSMAGTLVWREGLSLPGDSASEEIASPLTVEFFPSDDLQPDQALKVTTLLEESLPFANGCESENHLFYVPPTTGHEKEMEPHVQEFAAQGIRWIRREALVGGLTLQLLNSGEAYGTLRAVAPESLATHPLSYRDIALFSRLPNEIPLVGGTLTEELQTPLSHVNVAARGRKTPNLAMVGALKNPAIQALLDSLVHFKVTDETYVLEKTTLEEAEAFWKTRQTQSPEIPAPDLQSASIESFSRLGFADRARIGVKAANLAELFQLIPDHAPTGFAVPFARYLDFLAQAQVTSALSSEALSDCLKEGRERKLCEDVAGYRSRFTANPMTVAAFIDTVLDEPRFQTDTRFREASLDGLRYLLRHSPLETEFANRLDRYADSVFHGQTIRLRSSTNAEDLQDFNGAGLYSSTSADASGPDFPSQEIRKVWASAWNWRAFEERSFRGIDHRKVAVGVAVHPAFGTEAANGVLITRNLADPGLDGYYINVQLGEASVTNPTDGSLPEILTIAGPTVIRQRFSTLSPGAPLLSESEMAQLHALAQQVQNHFAKRYDRDPHDPDFALDIEFKLDAKVRRIVFKQVRPYP
jgi:pyruvate, water dikinase